MDASSSPQGLSMHGSRVKTSHSRATSRTGGGQGTKLNIAAPPMLRTAQFGVLEQGFRGAIDDAEIHLLECPHGLILRAAEPELRTP